MSRLARFAWLTLVFNVGVILLGALVRATGSGAGCGATWPTCEGELLPALEGARAVEFTHRATSGLALVLVIWLGIAVLRKKDGPIRFLGYAAIVSIVVEALIGAWIVLYRLVADDDSLARLVSVPLHLVNTLVLLAILTLLAWWLTRDVLPHRPLDPRIARVSAWSLGAMVVLAATGSVAALADTLAPAETLAEGLAADFDGSLLTGLRVVHPFVAVAVAVYLGWFSRLGRAGALTGTLGTVLLGLVVIQMFAGVLNVVLLVPVWMQLVHLLLADAVWVVTILFSNELLLETSGAAPISRPRSAELLAEELD